MIFNICLGKSGKELIVNSKNPNVTIDDVLLMVAEQYGDEWFGCSVQLKEKNSFICNAVEEYWRDSPRYKNASVYEIALRNYVSSLKIKMGFYKEQYNWRDDSVSMIPSDIFE